MKLFFSFLCGLVFGLGLLISGMANPSKVLNFLDLTGAWDPSLAFVMGGAILVAMIGFKFALPHTKSILGDQMRLPKSTVIDKKLILGNLIFGIGWGLAGYCPGPAITSLGLLETKPAIFVMGMLAGMLIYEIVARFWMVKSIKT